MAPTRLSWPLLLASASSGFVFAVLSIAGLLPDVASTQRVALALLGTIGVAVGLKAPDRPLLHGLAGGFLAGLVAVELQALFLTTYFANNPEFADIEMPFGWPPRVVTAVLGPLNAVLAAVVSGLVAWATSRVRSVF